jgi:small-conductance mechanosensitive channel
MTGQIAGTLTCAALTLAVSGWARAQDAPVAMPPPAVLLTEQAEQAHETAPVVVDGEELFRVRGFSGYPAQQRARLITERIEAAAGDASVPVSVKAAASPEGFRITAGDQFLMSVVDGDSRIEDLKTETLAAALAGRIEQAMRSYREARSPAVMLPAAQRAAAATLLLLVAVLLGRAVLARLDWRISRGYEERIRSVQIQSFEVVRAQRLRGMLRGATRLVRMSVFAVLVYLWLQYVLGLFPQTRPLAARLLRLLLDPLGRLAGGLVAELPALAFLLVLYFLTRWTLRLVRLFFESVERRQVALANFEPEWAMPTYRIVRIAIVAFALVVAYPYIPGSRSAAFQSVSIFLGVIFSLGSSSVIANVIAGYSMTYRRAFRLGDRIRVGDVIGEVTEIRLQVTHLRTLKNEEVVVPNSILLNSHVVNYSKLATSRGLILHTTVGIGYETPWRQVEAMLLEAAVRTPGLMREPPPFVLQKSLGDFCVVYEINVHCDDPARMPRLYTLLHQNILDVFNEYGVQIMTPAYEDDPEQPKVVPKDQWWTAPARPAAPAAPGQPGGGAST